MKRTSFYGVGGVLSADIAVPDHERELAFYASILTSGETPLWRDDLMNNLGDPVIGLGEQSPAYESLPLQWMPHFQVADVAVSVDEAIEMGGQELMRSDADDSHCQWAVLIDPCGAAFGLIPEVPSEPNGPPPDERMGCIAWLSLIVPDAAVSRAFYQRVIGWYAQPIQPAEADGPIERFEMRIDGGKAAAEIYQQSVENAQVPPTWLIHLPVDDLPESLRRVSQLGGQVVQACPELQYAIIRDPVGVHLALRQS